MTRRVVSAILVVSIVSLAVGATGKPSGKGRSEELKELAAAREQLAERALKKIEQWRSQPSSRKIDEREFVNWSRRLMESQLDLAETDEQRIAAVQTYVDCLSQQATRLRAMEKAGIYDFANDREMMEYCVLEGKEMLIRAEAKAD